MIKHYSIKVLGKVQGVSFRVYTRAKADELGVKGFVKNESDGSVFIEAEAEEDILKKFTEWCHQGSPRAQVSQCIIKEGGKKNYSGFNILH